eukprot:s1715_g5.t1
MSRLKAAPPAAAPKVSWSWLTSAGLQTDVSTKAIRFLEQSHVTRDMLDYFTSEEGQQVLQAYREKRLAQPAQVEASEAAPGRGLCGRQKISAAVRSNEGHYFAKAPKPEAPRPPKGKVSQKENEVRPDKKEAPAEKMEVLGCVKSFSEDRGYGFLASEAAPGDIYFRAGDVPADDAAQVGRYCSFTLHFKDGHPQARSLCWLTEEVPLTSRAEGFVKSLGANYGFITSKAIGAHDIYVDRKELEKLGSCANGQPVSFRLAQNARGQPQAKDVQLLEEPCPEARETKDAGETAPVGPVRSKYW